jgi:hypothetical protein
VLRCERLASCVVPVSAASLGDSCPDTPKYLEVHYYCREEEHAPLSARPSPQFPDTELTALWNQHGHKVNIDSVLQAVKERPPADAEDDEAAAGVRVPITTVATVAETATAPAATTNVTTRPGPRIQFVLPSEDTTTESSLVSNSTQAGQERTAEAANGGSEVQAWAANNTSELRSRQEEEEEETNNNNVENDEEKEEEEEEKDRVDTMFVLEVVTYAVASVCGVIIVFLILKVIHP